MAHTTPFGGAGTRILEMTTSNEFNAIVQMDKHGKSLAMLVDLGTLCFSQYRDPEQFPPLAKIPCINLNLSRGAKPPPEPRTLAFSKDGTEFLLLNGNVSSSLLDFPDF